MNNNPNQNDRQQQNGNRTTQNSARPTQNGTRPAQNSARPTQNGARPAQNGARPTQNGARPAQNGARPTQNGRPANKKRKLTFQPNRDGIMAAITLLLVLVLVVTIIICVVKAITKAASGDDRTTDTTVAVETTTEITTAPPATDFETTAPVAGSWNEGYVLEKFSNTKVYEGDLILVNYANEYKFPAAMEKKLDKIYGKTGYSSIYVLSTADTMLNMSMYTHLVQLLTQMKTENFTTLSSGDRIIINSGYRTLDYQQGLYDKAVSNGTEGYSARAGYSEHHTGLAFDIKIFTEKNQMIDLRASEQNWLLANCAKYGFILRYPADKTDLTQILEESWHFRYVGVPHAQYMMENNICLEEYIDILRTNHAYGQAEPLNYTADGKDHIIYYVPASVVNDTTAVPVPASGNYTISGNNSDGFIVTVTK